MHYKNFVIGLDNFKKNICNLKTAMFGPECEIFVHSLCYVASSSVFKLCTRLIPSKQCHQVSEKLTFSELIMHGSGYRI